MKNLPNFEEFISESKNILNEGITSKIKADNKKFVKQEYDQVLGSISIQSPDIMVEKYTIVQNENDTKIALSLSNGSNLTFEFEGEAGYNIQDEKVFERMDVDVIVGNKNIHQETLKGESPYSMKPLGLIDYVSEFFRYNLEPAMLESVETIALEEMLRKDGHNFDIVHPEGKGGGSLKVGADGILYDDMHFISWDKLMDLKKKYN